MDLLAYAARRKVPPLVPPGRFTLPAPNGSINTIASGGAFPPEDCISRDNLIPGEFGIRTRLGSREWCTNLDGPVKSLLPFTGSLAVGSNDRLFATTATGIWDVTDSSAAPTQVVAFPTVDDDAGWGKGVVFVTVAGHFLCYTDEANGLYVYAESTDTWAKVAQGAGADQIQNVNPADFVDVCAWKNRLWFVERGSASAWYLPLNAIFGAAAEFNFGARFPHGGDLRCLSNWSFDGGQGIDDQLVAIGGGGDVVVYQGTDPSSASTFGIRAVWYAGGVPLGRRLTTDNGGDLLVMASMGIFPLSRLTAGMSLVAPAQYETQKIANLFAGLQTQYRNARGWAMVTHPQDATLLVLVPSPTPKPLAMSIWNKGWSTYSGLPIGKCAAPWNGTLYFGTDDGRVMVNDGFVDGVTLADSNSYSAIPYSVLTGFSKLGDPRQKQVTMMRPTILGAQTPQYQIEARYRWDQAEVSGVGDTVAAGPNDWDEGEWGAAEWSAETTADQAVRGAVGMGPEVAFAIRGEATTRTTIVDIDAEFTVGGFL